MKYEYTGDVNIEHGGCYISYEDIEYGYCNAVRVMFVDDVDVIFIEQTTINLPNDMKGINDALSVCDFEFNGFEIIGNDMTVEVYSPQFVRIIAECCLAYGYYDIESTYTVLVPDLSMLSQEEISDHRKTLSVEGGLSIEGVRINKVANSGFNLEGFVEKQFNIKV